MFNSELHDFKTAIDLRFYAAAHGYVFDRKESWRGSAVMRHPASNDKIIIKRGTDGHYLWFSVRTDAGGTIIDFVQHLRARSLGEIRKELRPWIGKPPVSIPEFPVLRETAKDRVKVGANLARMTDASSGHPYLEGERGLPPSLLAHKRFAGRIRLDARGSAVFPHFDTDGVCGYELKNAGGFTGFASGGVKGLWLSHEFDADVRLVFAESAIDALSFAALFGESGTRFASIGGKLNAMQPALIRAAIERLPSGEVVTAMDADEEGAKLSGAVTEAFETARRDDLLFRRQEPVGFKDFNDQLRGNAQSRSAVAHGVQPR